VLRVPLEKVAQLLAAVQAGIEVGPNPLDVRADRAEVCPAAVVRLLFDGLPYQVQRYLLIVSRPGGSCRRRRLGSNGRN
jgi:hypothetical protein